MTRTLEFKHGSRWIALDLRALRDYARSHTCEEVIAKYGISASTLQRRKVECLRKQKKTEIPLELQFKLTAASLFVRVEGVGLREAADAVGLKKETLKYYGVKSSLPVGWPSLPSEKLRYARQLVQRGVSLKDAAKAVNSTPKTLRDNNIRSKFGPGSRRTPLQTLRRVDKWIKRGMTQKEAASRAGIHPRTWRTNKHRLETAES